ncbi:MAG: M6 family metalloprotease domain-containing protein, partial [Muribaculaceae bacterium]|nr:M6 family metalloprotease domain-containing protein [Muribaculaceae bacterium]
MKFNWMLRGVSIMLTAIFSTVSLYAVIAKPGIVNLRQADGTSLQARIIGEEYFHTYLTPEGYPLVYENGNYVYAFVSDGNLVSTGVKAVNKDLRPENHLRLLSNIEHSAVENYFDTSYSLAKRSAEATKAPKRVVTGDRSRYVISNFPNYGKQKGLVILVEYNDVKFTLDDPHDYFSRLLNEPGFSDLGGTGSARDYFIESSHGQFLPDFDVFGPITLPENREYYGSNTGGYNDAYAWKMVTTAAEYLDDIIDFSEYDRDNDGYVDNIYVFYAGEGESGGGGYETVWPHAAQIAIIDKKNQHIHDGKIIDHYACSNEMDFEKPDGVGTFCHEFSHVMGLPDFYATGYQASFTPGALSLLDSGSYNNESRTPPLYSAFERYCVGWLDLEVIEGKDNIVLPPIGSNKAYAIETGNPDEFYILENRQKISWDSKMPAHGMLVWHVDYDKEAWSTNSVNNDPLHQRLDVVEADDMRDYDSYDGDTFPGVKGVTSFTDDTTPSMKTWDGKRLSMPITDIKESEDGFISFKICGGSEEIAAPYGARVAVTGSQTAEIEWDAVEGATDYLITLFTPENFFLIPGYDKKSSNGNTKIEVSGLTPESSYG